MRVMVAESRITCHVPHVAGSEGPGSVTRDINAAQPKALQNLTAHPMDHDGKLRDFTILRGRDG